ncbi:MAG: FAD-dependent monooxygenase [Myxococcales bacterium]|nr:FAD-dependent monooxygenase [Myxococcales bacterium]
MSATSHAIGIVGAGTAGAAAAILLGRAGHRVTLFERVAEPSPVGAGITLQPTGQAALARLGLLEPIRASGARIDRLHAQRRGGRPLLELEYAEIDPALHGLGIHRGVLFETLFSAARTTATAHLGITITDSVVDARGRWLVDGTGERHGPFELVIAADGSVCELHALAPRVRSQPYPWGALWFVAADRDGALSSQRALLQTVDGARLMLGLLPTGLAPGGTHPVISLFFSLRGDQVDAWRARGLAAWRDQVLRLDPRAEPLLDQLSDLDPVLFTRYRDVAMYPWHTDRMVFLGDAAHATSPQLGQGANLALIDALVLADALAAEATIAGALARYTRERRAHLAFYQLATRALTPLFQSDSRLIGWMRDLIFPTSRWLRPLRRRMVLTMIGAERGLIRRAMPLDDLTRLLE